MNIEAGRNFNAGQRAVFFALGYIGWFVSGLTFICATLFVTLVLVQRQFASPARYAISHAGLSNEDVGDDESQRS